MDKLVNGSQARHVKISPSVERLLFMVGPLLVGLFCLLLINVHRLDGTYAPIVAVLVVVVAAWVTYIEAHKAMLTAEGIRFLDLKSFWKIRPIFVS